MEEKWGATVKVPIVKAPYGSSLWNLCLGYSIEPIIASLVQQRDPVR